MRVLVLTTSYPRFPGDAAGSFVADAVEAVRVRGVDVRVVSPSSAPLDAAAAPAAVARARSGDGSSDLPFRHFGIAYGSGITGNLRAAPWKAALLPPMLVSFARAARRAARGVDVVHAHWLSASVAALAAGKPFVLQLWGTDVELARRAPRLFRPLVGRAALVVCASSALADDARRLGAREVRVVPHGVELPETVGEPDEPPHVLYAGRLSPEKGILEFLAATEGLPRVVVGDGPLRDRVPESLGTVPRHDLGAWYERAAVVCVPSRREGFGVVCLEAMAHGRPVVARAVGGLLDLVEDGETGLLVRDDLELRRAVERLLADATLRGRMGDAARRRARERFSWDAAASELTKAYGDAATLGRP